MGEESVIRVVDLSFQYPQASEAVLRHISFEVRAGEVVGLAGPSGAGKTTLCLALKGLIPHAVTGSMWGDVFVAGQNTRTTRVERIAEAAGLVFQDPEAQIIGLTILEDLAFGPENLLVDTARILERAPKALATVGLRGMEARETYKMSGGQKQRLAIASVLMMEPRILILDEPTSELDPKGREEVYETVRELREAGATIIFVDHDLEHLANLADRILLLNRGVLVQDCRIEDVFSDPAHAQLIRPPQVTEVAWALRDMGLLDFDKPPIRERDAIAMFSHILGGGH